MISTLAPRILALSGVVALAACGGNERPTGPGGSTPVAVTLSAIAVSPAAVQVHAGLTLQLAAEGTFSDGSKRDLTNEVEWISSDPALATISNEDGSRGLLRGLAAGAINVQAKKGEVMGERAATVDPAKLTGLAIQGATENEQIGRGTTKALTAQGTFSDATTAAVTAELTWRSSDDAIATVSAEGLVTALAVGAVTITVNKGDVSATLALTVACVYPGTATAQIIRGGIMPNLRWATARQSDGSSFEFSMEKVFCGEQLPDAKVIFFQVGTGWCPNCPRAIRALNAIADDVQGAGGGIVYVEMQDDNYDPTDSANATAYIDRLLGPGAPGIRVGDSDIARPANLPFNRSPEIRAIPFVFAVRVRDMKYITDDNAFTGAFPYVNIATNPDMFDSTMPPAMCMEGTEEASEPNDTSEQAASVNLGSPVSGGICAAAPDFFWVDVQGPWRATLSFTHNVGDLDMYVWDTFTDRPLTSRGETVGSNGNGDTETINWQGPSLVRVEGYQGGQGPYTFRVEQR